MVQIRDLMIDDTEEFLALGRRLFAETDFMAYTADDFNMPIEKLRNMNAEILKHDESNIFVALIDNEMVGFLSALGSRKPRIAHTVTGGMGVLKQYQNQGVGRKLLATVEDWALQRGMIRLELTVMKNNDSAIHLYEKFGFKVEGVKQCAFKVNDQYFDGYLMAKILEVQPNE